MFVNCNKTKDVAQKWFEECKQLSVGAEHGFFIKYAGQSDWKNILRRVDLSWIENVRDMMRQYSEKTDGAFIEEKESMIVWNYKDSDHDLGKWQAKELTS